MAKRLQRGHTVSFDSTWHSTDSAPAPPPPLTRPRLQTVPSTLNESDGLQEGEAHGRELWQSVRSEHMDLLEGETYTAHCSVSVAISNRSGAVRSRRNSFTSPTSGYHKVEVFVTDYSLHLFRQRRAVTLNGLSDVCEVYRSLPLMSLQEATVSEGEGHHTFLVLVFERNKVKARFTDVDSAHSLQSTILTNRNECRVQARQRQSRLLLGGSGASSASVQQYHSLSAAAAQRQEEGGAHAVQALSSHSWLNHLFVTLQLRPREVYQPLENQGDFCFRRGRWKHLESDRTIIKYPRPDSVLSLPTECYFRMDDIHVALLWKPHTKKHYSHSKCITLDQVVEVRRGQQTEGFSKFPYRATERHSLSLMFEAEKKVRAFSANRYVTLHSIDIVCETSKEADDWIGALGEYHFDTGKKLFPKQLKYLDHTLIWLKTHFSVQGTHFGEISLDKVNKFFKLVKPDLNSGDVHKWFMYAKSCLQHDTTISDALTWKGFVSVYDHFVDMEAKQLLALFRQFAREEPQVGMTEKEFRWFLLESQKWPEESCCERKCRRLLDAYDSHHTLYKERVGRGAGKCSPLQLSLYLSFPGFLSFVRGKDNQIIAPEHEEVYQDMTRPLAHYFINSSHNTFLEGHQWRGNSSYEAYIRPLLHGVRCLEIDCWDDEVGGIVVTHGGTPTTRLSFPRVLKTIKEYAFVASEYPLILSLENHCKKDNRKRMAKLLEEEFGHHLVSEDLESWQRRAHLPSPADLKHKILLKDSFRYQRRDQDGESPSLPETLPSPNGLSPLPPHLFQGTTVSQPRGLSESQLRRMSEPQFQGVSESQLRGVSESQPRGVSASQPRGVSESQLRGVSESQLRGVSESQLRGVSESQLRGVSESQPRGVSESQPRGVSESQLRGVSESQLRGVSESQLRGVSESQPRGVSESQPRGVSESQPRGVSESQPRGVRTCVTFDIPETADYFHSQKHRRQARTFHGLVEHRSSARPIYVGPSHLALDRSISAPASELSVEEEELDPPTIDRQQNFAWNFLSRFSHVDEARARLERQTEEEHIDEKEMAQELTKLVYLRSQKIKPGQLWEEAPNLQPCEMLSFKETRAMDICRDNPGDLLQLSSRCLLRVYPKGYRIASENYNPIPLWNYGMQLVALNHQTPDMCLHINQGKFRQNGSCGYILKPKCLQERFPADTSPAPHTAMHSREGNVVNLEMKFVSGQNLSPGRVDVESFKIWVVLSGIEHDSTCNLETFRKLNTDTPPLFEARGQDMSLTFFDFPECTKLSHPLLYPEMCVVYVRVEVQPVRSMGRRPTPILYGQNAIPVESLREGLRFLPLRDSCGHLIHQSGFFVLICKTALNPGRSRLTSQTTVISRNGHLDNTPEVVVQNGGHVQGHSDEMNSDDKGQTARQKRISRQHPIEGYSDEMNSDDTDQTARQKRISRQHPIEGYSDEMNSDDTDQTATQKRISRQHSIEELSMSSECAVVELY